MSKYAWLLIGLLFSSLVTGILVGVSQTPVVGVFFTAFFGLSGATLSIVFSKKEARKEGNTVQINYNIIGIGIFLFSVFLLFGCLLGANYRSHIVTLALKKDRNFVWNEKNKPQSLYEALDWIKVENTLSKMGYSREEITSLYRMSRDKPITDSTYLDPYNFHNKGRPYYSDVPFSVFLTDNETETEVDSRALPLPDKIPD
jgi:hypothetical protein